MKKYVIFVTGTLSATSWPRENMSMLGMTKVKELVGKAKCSEAGNELLLRFYGFNSF